MGVVCLAAWQVWLTWRLTEQDRNLELQRSRERLEHMADLAISQVVRVLSDWDVMLAELKSFPPPSAGESKFPPGATFILISDGSVAVYPSEPLLFVPDPPRAGGFTPAVFEATDQLEFRRQQHEQAIGALQPLLTQAATRPEALLRIARIQRKAGRLDAALKTYQRLTLETAINPSDTPYGLLAANARCHLLIDLGRRLQARQEAEAIHAGLLVGRWQLRRTAFEYYWGDLDRLGLAVSTPPKPAFELSVLVSTLYDRWRTFAHSADTVNGRDPRMGPSLVVWSATADRTVAMVAPRDWLKFSVKLPPDSTEIRWKLVAPGTPVEPGLHVTRSLTELQLDGRLDLFMAGEGANAARGRRLLWLAGVGLMILLLLVSGYAVHRGTTQELRAARLQSDFVSAVSHEFRSPLTTLRTLTELLAQDRIMDEGRRRQSYVFLDRETHRLHRLVEDLLDFGRMESGRKQYRLERLDAFQLVRAAVEEFREGAAANGFQVETTLGAGYPVVQADEEAFRRVTRNLLENAVKYSPECRTVWVDGVVSDYRVLISVRDRGMGIDPVEQRAIFQKFVRGNAAKREGIKGTGIGLSMVQQILEAAGGEISVVSSVGAGSTFTIAMPLAE